MFKNIRIDRRVNSRKIMYSALAFTLIGITTMTIAYATLSTTLKITGSAEFQDASWNLVLEEFTDYPWDTTGASKVDGNLVVFGSGKLLQKPTIQGTTIGNYKVSIAKAGDGVFLEYKLTNMGDIPARLDSVTWSDPVVTSSTNDQDDIQLIYNYFEPFPEIRGLIKEDGVVTSSYPVGEDSILCPGAVFEILISNYYDHDAPRVPYSKVEISNLSVDFNFVAADQNLCDGDTPLNDPDYNDKPV